MPKRCANCGDLRRIRELPVPPAWLSYLQDEREMAGPVGTLMMPLCPRCYRDARQIVEDGADVGAASAEFLDDIAVDTLVDEGV